MTPTQKQILERLHKMRDEVADKMTHAKHDKCGDTFTAYFMGYKAGADSTNDIIMKLVAGLEFDFDCGDNSCRFARKDKRGGMRTNGGCRCLEKHRIEVTKLLLNARQLLEELKGGVE